MPYCPVNDIQLYYEEFGNGSGAPLVLVHGFSGCLNVWEPTIARFKEQYRIIAVDLRGHARSSGAPETIHHEWFAQDLVALLDYLKIDRAHFMGHSSGGMCLLFLGTRYPQVVRTLTLVNATYTFDEHARRHMLYVANELAPKSEAVAQSDRVHGVHKGNGYWKVLTEAFRQFTRDPDELPFTPRDLGAITKPVFVLHGDRDLFFPVNIPVTMYQSMPNAELCIVPMAGHDVPVSHFELFIQLTTQFLTRHAEA